MGLMNFLTGVAGRETSALFSIWAIHTLLAIMCFLYLLLRGEVRHLIAHVKKNPKGILALGFFDNGAWIFYTTSMILIPISIATALSESYVVLAALLGVFVNKEKLHRHQVIGIVVSVACAITLASRI